MPWLGVSVVSAIAVAAIVPLGPAHAQGLVGGTVVEVSSGRALRCICVSLVDTSGRTVDSTFTRRGGAFFLQAPAAGSYRVRFSAGGLTDVTTAAEYVATDSQLQREFRIPLMMDSAMRAYVEGDGKRALVHPGLLQPRRNAGPSYPEELRRASIEGDVLLAFSVDATGMVDTSTVLPLLVTHTEFYRAVLASFRRRSYLPWRPLDGQDCALLLQPYVFRVDRDWQ